jgi:hypothetical protein
MLMGKAITGSKVRGVTEYGNSGGNSTPDIRHANLLSRGKTLWPVMKDDRPAVQLCSP